MSCGVKKVRRRETGVVWYRLYVESGRMVRTYWQSRGIVTDVENKLMVAKVGRGGGTNWELRIDIYTLLCMKWITNEDLLFSTGNPTQ